MEGELERLGDALHVSMRSFKISSEITIKSALVFKERGIQKPMKILRIHLPYTDDPSTVLQLETLNPAQALHIRRLIQG